MKFQDNHPVLASPPRRGGLPDIISIDGLLQPPRTLDRWESNPAPRSRRQKKKKDAHQ